MDYEELQQYQQSLLDRALAEGIRRNSEQTETWSEYKNRHEKVIEGLEIFPKDLTVDCMVPIGKRALMRGKLTHTNEILVSLGDGYFAKYSAAQAIELCNRRIKRAKDILESLEKERNLYEMRQRIPDAFGGDGRKDFIEHWDKEKLDDWRVEHRQREKEYRKKLAELRNTEKQEIQTEDDLFAKLDALELQEELEAELHRLEAKRPDFYTQDLQDGEVYEEESDESSECETEDESEEQNDDRDTRMNKEATLSRLEGVEHEIQSVSSSSDDKLIVTSSDTKILDSQKIETNFLDSSQVTFGDSSINESTKSEARERRVVFGEPQVKYFNVADTIEAISQNSSSPTQSGTSMNKETKDSDDEDEDEDDIIRIEFKHSDNEPEIFQGNEDSFLSPRDIYRMLSKPKSILKNSINSTAPGDDHLPTNDNSSTDDEIEDSPACISAYNTIVKEIREHVEKPMVEMIERVEEKRSISKFKRERAGMKK